MNEKTRPVSARFTEHPETIEGDVSQEFIDFLLHVHPDQPYDSAMTALLCRQAYDLGKKEQFENTQRSDAKNAS